MKKGLLFGALLLCVSFSLQAMHREEFDEEEAKERFFKSADKCDVKLFSKMLLLLQTKYGVTDINDIKDRDGGTILHRLAKGGGKCFKQKKHKIRSGDLDMFSGEPSYRRGKEITLYTNFCNDIWFAARDSGAKLDIQDENGNTAFHIFAQGGLFYHKGWFGRKRKYGFAPYAPGPYRDYFPTWSDGYKRYLQEDVISIKNNDGRTALHVAAESGNVLFIEGANQATSNWLEGYGNELLEQDNYGNTALHWAKSLRVFDLLDEQMEKAQGSLECVRRKGELEGGDLLDPVDDIPIDKNEKSWAEYRERARRAEEEFDEFVKKYEKNYYPLLKNKRRKSWRQFHCKTTTDKAVINLCKLYKGNDCRSSNSDMCDEINEKRYEFFRKYHPNK